MQESILRLVAACEDRSVAATKKRLLQMFADGDVDAADRPTPAELNKELRKMVSKKQLFMKKDNQGTHWTKTEHLQHAKPTVAENSAAASQEIQKKSRMVQFSKLPLGLSRITDTLYIGSARDANDVSALRREGISSVVSCVGGWKLADRELRHLVIDLEDEEYRELLDPHLAAVVDWIDPNEKTLIHCHVGKSRSVAMAVAYLCESKGISLTDSWTLVKQGRPMASPNSGFLRQLMRRFPAGASWDLFMGEQEDLKGWLDRHARTRGGRLPTTHLYWTPHNRKKLIYHVPKEKQAEFESQYALAALTGTPRLVECITADTFPLFLDVDVRTVEKEPDVDRLMQFLVPLISGNGRMVICGAASAYKLGLHVTFPDTFVDKNGARQFIARLQSTVTLPAWITSNNSIAEVFDLSPIESANLRMIYSAKSIPCKSCKRTKGKKGRKRQQSNHRVCPSCAGSQLEPERIYQFLGLFGNDGKLLDMCAGNTLAQVRRRVALCSIRSSHLL